MTVYLIIGTAIAASFVPSVVMYWLECRERRED
jgi:hypothetical protein